MHYSETESKRFNFRIFRQTDTEIRPEILKSDLIRNQADILILRIPAAAQRQLHLLDAAGLPYILADTQVEYSIRTQGLPPVALHNKIEMVECRPEEEEKFRLIDEMIDRTFQSYPNHYFANPLLPETGSRQGYMEWVRDCYGEKGVAWLLYVDGSPAGFFSGRYYNGQTFEAGPGAILPEYEGKLIYLDCVKTIPRLLQEKGFTWCKTATQSHNLVVQKQWLLAGSAFSNAQVTVHLNPLFGKAGQGKKVEHKYTGETEPAAWAMRQILGTATFEKARWKNFNQTWLRKMVNDAVYSFHISSPIPIRDGSGSVFSATLTDKYGELAGFFQAGFENRQAV